MTKIIFVGFIFAWLFVGFLGGLWAKEDGIRPGVAMAIFIACVPAIPLMAHLCGLI